MSDDARRKWREAYEQERRAAWDLEDAQRREDVDPKANRKKRIKELLDTASGSAVHSAVGVVVGFVCAWLLRGKRNRQCP